MFSPAAKERLPTVIISPDASVSEAIAHLDSAGTGALLLVASDGQLVGMLTDGDVRRAILGRKPLTEPCRNVGNLRPIVVPDSIAMNEALRLMNEHDVNHLPVVDEAGKASALLLRKDLVEEDLGLSAVIMAGGFGTRLQPLTDTVPKPMLPLGDRPVLERILEKLRLAGIREANITTHYLHQAIQEHFGDGRPFGLRLNYFQEDHPLGTAGGLRLMQRANGTQLVINGDVLTGVKFDEMLGYHRKHHADLTVAVRRYDLQVPYGVVECEDVRVTRLEEKPAYSFFINAGAYLIEPGVYDFIPQDKRFDMTDLIQSLLDAGRPVVSFPIVEYWLDMGRHEDYAQAQEDVRNGII